MKKKFLMVAGPCAAEDQAQIITSIKAAKKLGIDFLRVSLWKPRTKPGFDGLGEEGIRFLIEAAKQGVNPATEVILPQHAEMVIKAVLPATKKGRLLLWIGARNQNHYIQQEISRVVAGDKRVTLMVKNQPWESEEHWDGIIEHCLAGGIAKTNLFVCHRGFSPTNGNPQGYRNIPNYEMAMRIREKSKLPMLFDPSHTGGSVENVFYLAKEASSHSFDGFMIEVHPNPAMAKTDAKQQLSWEQLAKLLKELKH